MVTDHALSTLYILAPPSELDKIAQETEKLDRMFIIVV